MSLGLWGSKDSKQRPGVYDLVGDDRLVLRGILCRTTVSDSGHDLLDEDSTSQFGIG